MSRIEADNDTFLSHFFFQCPAQKEPCISFPGLIMRSNVFPTNSQLAPQSLVVSGLYIQRLRGQTCSAKVLSAIWPVKFCGSAVGPTERWSIG